MCYLRRKNVYIKGETLQSKGLLDLETIEIVDCTNLLSHTTSSIIRIIKLTQNQTSNQLLSQL